MSGFTAMLFGVTIIIRPKVTASLGAQVRLTHYAKLKTQNPKLKTISTLR